MKSNLCVLYVNKRSKRQGRQNKRRQLLSQLLPGEFAKLFLHVLENFVHRLTHLKCGWHFRQRRHWKLATHISLIGMLPYASLVSGACLFQGFFSSFAWQLCLVLRQSEQQRFRRCTSWILRPNIFCFSPFHPLSTPFRQSACGFDAVAAMMLPVPAASPSSHGTLVFAIPTLLAGEDPYTAIRNLNVLNVCAGCPKCNHTCLT